MQSRKNSHLLISAGIILIALVFSASKIFYEKKAGRQPIKSSSKNEEAVLVSEREGWINYAIAKRDLDGDGADEIVRLFKSIKPAGQFADGKAMYDLDLTVSDGGRSVYSFAEDIKGAAPEESAAKYFLSETIDFFDVTGEGARDLAFKSASSEGVTRNHMVYFDKGLKKFARVSPREFIPGEDKDFSWIKKGSRGYPLAAQKVTGGGKVSPSEFVFKKYVWNANERSFETAGEIPSVRAYETAGQAIYNEGNALPFSN